MRQARPPGDGDQTPVVALHEVEVSYVVGGERVPVLENLDLMIRSGEFVSLMGQSGSGKSTILNVIAGLLPPVSGQVRLAQQELYDLDDHARTLLRRSTVGFIFQFFNLIPSLNVVDNVALPLLIAGSDPRASRARLDQLLELVGLDHRRSHYPSQLSGGEMQRVTIARALVTEPRLVLADEPTGNVSARMGQEVMAILRRAHRELGQTIFMVTHNHKDAAQGDRVVFLAGGSLAPGHELSGSEVDEAHILSVLQELDI